MNVHFFATPRSWRAWLAKHHARETMLWVGFWRVATRKPSITWPQSVDQALCFGWIDGLRRGLDAESYAIRFTPRSAKSLWSRVNLKRFVELDSLGQVHGTGRAARAKWDEHTQKTGYSHETPRAGIDAKGEAALKANAHAWRFWEAQMPSYRKMAGHWTVSAKREETRAARLATLIDCCARGLAIPPVAKWVKVKLPGK
ncbi:MAG: YdeI/OmpD-associated family protein [Candidatus Eisenbacteria bacterium]